MSPALATPRRKTPLRAPRPRTTARKRERTAHNVSAYWRNLLGLLPNYDCFKNADDFYFDEAAANFVCEFFETRLHHVEGDLDGQLIKLEPWQKAFLGAIFGWKQKANGLRRYDQVMLYIPRKNGKTTIAAGIVLLMLTCENEGGQQIYFGAANREQARLTKTIAERMIAYDDDLSATLKVLANSIETRDKQHICRVLSKAPTGQHGRNCNLAIMDELHEHQDGRLCEAITTSMGARSQPLTIYTTTADSVRESICNTKYEYACGVRDGLIPNRRYLPVIYETLSTDDWSDPEVWQRCNPSLGSGLRWDRFQAAFDEVQHMRSEQNGFKRLRLNLRTQSATDWLDINDWDRCAGLIHDEGPRAWRDRILAALKGKRCWGGLDLGAVSDLTAYVLIFDGADCGYHGSLVAIPYFWCPKDAIPKMGEINRELYTAWEQDGFLITTHGDVMDYAVLKSKIVSLNAACPLYTMTADTSFQGHELCISLKNDHGVDIVSFAQSFTNYDAPTKELENRTKNQTIIHGGNPILRWMASHVMVAEDRHQRIKPVKEKRQSSKKIDGIAATVFSLAGWHIRDKDQVNSRYNDPDVKLLIVGGK